MQIKYKKKFGEKFKKEMGLHLFLAMIGNIYT